MRLSFRIAAAALAVGGLLGMSFSASAQTYPHKPLRWVVGYPAGGGTDFLARTVGAQLSHQIGQQAVVDNRPGASAILASELVARSAPDGYTIFSADNGVLVYNSLLYKKLRYDPQKDFALLGMMGRSPLVIVASPQLGIKDAQGLLAALRKEPGKYSIGTAGTGSPHHLALELFQREANVSLQHIPYKGGAPALQELMGNQIPLMMLDLPSGISAVKAGKAIPLLAMSGERIPQLPNVPTARELGFSKVEAYTWQGLVVPKGTPADIQKQLSTELQKAMHEPAVRQSLFDAGWEARPSNAEDMARYVKSERETWSVLVKDKNIQLD
ncbi:tripartite tricarboxylate transporter substrate binding protein [Comamonas sp. Y33R10-2]|uniref:Bug family tripartite tricarboxylate transporter substrate binding protein n=1 Tax=Comamonas sp. Y33R10-2 TaxID=2853257 RepID=UPI001C5C8D61|nr:tripartite tricarboxylate transporter substrate binding protein [Comamonas sp. Y33R10-2]QXZ08773.1 tripartite tricarboxylate transporter substrate binding protein [Comamonas sp. Y33R10-2]